MVQRAEMDLAVPAAAESLSKHVAFSSSESTWYGCEKSTLFENTLASQNR